MAKTTTLQVNRKSERINIRDDDGRVAYEWEVATDDESLQTMLVRVGNAFERAKELADASDAATTPEELEQTTKEIVKLQKRVISAIIGPQGYQDILEYIGDGEAVDPARYIRNVGDVFGSLCVWLYQRCTSKQLREAGVYFEGEQRRTNGQWTPDNRKARRAKKGGKKR